MEHLGIVTFRDIRVGFHVEPQRAYESLHTARMRAASRCPLAVPFSLERMPYFWIATRGLYFETRRTYSRSIFLGKRYQLFKIIRRHGCRSEFYISLEGS